MRLIRNQFTYAMRFLRFKTQNLVAREYQSKDVHRFYTGWYETPEGKCIAFIRPDGSLQFRW